MSSFSALEALLGTEETLAQDSRIRMICLFDNEEVGSASAYGADSDLIETVLSRLHVNVASSFLVSADMAHAVHPNYSSVHEDSHRPALHKGPVLKYNANQKYATTATTAFIIKEVANRKKIPLQEYVVRNDGRCGSTIGNILAPKVGIRTVDLGQPQLSMHSIREMAAVDDTYYSVQLFKGFFNEVTEIDKNLPRQPRSIVNVSSISGTHGNAGQTNYSTAKMGVVGLTKTIAKEWGFLGIRCNAVAFGSINTRLTAGQSKDNMIEVDGEKIRLGIPTRNAELLKMAVPLGRAGEVDEAAGSILLLCSPFASYISGQVLEVTGGSNI